MFLSNTENINNVMLQNRLLKTLQIEIFGSMPIYPFKAIKFGSATVYIYDIGLLPFNPPLLLAKYKH